VVTVICYDGARTASNSSSNYSVRGVATDAHCAQAQPRVVPPYCQVGGKKAFTH
jgi:hypothetical protein